MAFEVIKRIKGRSYRRKSRWRYVGPVNEGSAPVRRRRRLRREDIVSATVGLLEFRDPRNVTVAVIAASAGVSRGVFYHHFRNQREVMIEALARMRVETIRALPNLGAARTLHEAREHLLIW
jgi:AcrR family transcriptional regulator